MPRRTAAQSAPRNTARTRTRRIGPSHLWPSARLRRRWWHAFLNASAVTKVFASVAVALTLLFAINSIYQVIRKPSELFFPVSGTLYKTPVETWREYQPAFEKYSTSIMTPELLA